ncbi:hypothetical protein QM012_001361 [Aureobasidium pullulans]|uniref:FAD-binding FR-type domain-containing protein n=1 Tax=Aureobasidium pullulans TaxID=5580 RepID=A0ABR0TDV9_AURPU
MKIVEFDEIPAGRNTTDPVRLSKAFFERVGNTLTTWEYEMNWHHQSSLALYGFWGIVLGASTIVRLIRSTKMSFQSPQMQSSATTRMFQSVWMWVRVNLVIPPAFGTHHQRLLYWCTIPTRMESIVVAAFYILTTYLSVSHYRLISNNIYWDDKSHQLWRYVADRTGIMAYEGWGMFRREFTQLWLLLGVVATITMGLLLVFSVSWLRVKFYEFFLVVHIVLSVVTLVGCFLHTSIFDARYDAYLWPVAIVWVLDRALRLLRLITCSVHVRLGKQTIHRTYSTASYSKKSDVIRLDMRTDSFLAQPAAGQFYYLYQPSTWQGYENHPFTLGAWKSPTVVSDTASDSLLRHTNMPSELDEPDLDSRYRPAVRTLTFWIRPYDGWTRRLRDECLQASARTVEPTILLEGPYGHHCPISSFDSVLLIAGGTGIASAVPYILEHMAQSEVNEPVTTRMHLIWTVRQASFIEEVFAQELRPAAQRDDFSADLFFTRKSEGPKHGRNHSECEDIRYLNSKLQYGRPDITSAIAKAATRAEMTRTKVAVLVCGPPAMADEARLAVHRSLRRGCHSVEYFEESFGW